ncbi:N-acetyl-D-Glu racemase DgcA [Aurantimonas endophytica]|uniref:Dipeptide epimerase n=1 Tax=Aurantimonas endophytica TaxID=1522175 RepID=A0A7W6MNF0_9HYPH|nr:N-acetyl-D-Glu racemase DgcA [Aurantimonas endophytica]MBB4001833.1 L-alanine-DL-glutamate epimerase-like enolase superfamily enzyme [Aurantimonas endophytica]MCO6402530.1 dipeptide epimerase [Aurantimonas endophytica]
MPRRVSVTVEHFPLAREFRISRGAKTEAVVIVCEIEEGSFRGRGECVPYARYGESIDSVVAAMESARAGIERGASRDDLGRTLPAGAARNALDCALWDLEAKASGQRVAALICRTAPRPLETAYTIGIDAPAAMADAAKAARRSLLKIKVGTEDDLERMAAIHAATNGARLILDANEGWTAANIGVHLQAAAATGAVLVEQPLPKDSDAILADIPHPVPICADESVHTTEDLEALRGRYDYVNVKLDKTGGLTEALRLVARAQELGFGVMVGCMVGTSLAMAPAVLLAQMADFVDLDGPLLLAKDRPHGLVDDRSTVAPPTPELWG